MPKGIKPKAKINITIDQDVFNGIETVCEKTSLSRSAWINFILRREVEKELKMNRLTIEDIARIAHQLLKTYRETINDDTQYEDWDKTEDWQKNAAIKAVKHVIDNPDETPAEHHKAWSDRKIMEGWKHGKKKDPEKKTHPFINIDYENLPEEQQKKAELFQNTVRALIK